ncbi:Lrp/AsnC family transcriptional regulator [Ideonella sp. 4Y16]|uniref:Lrp/AsnC family transcriptional regulator n=1 Tax=Ideonella alba TaxID=2824118 RepID=A0A940YB28_9BURK|nr:Lrp/AsnC family transcriptional regulator [Ideonella alba]MBQ0931420.1 Lrp/AsnC family transcriptional regulator [Ideonella alba]MBQ0944992.1 Lrp/AsnC family transcriptional regulator [Ideonella alba]
MTFDVDARSWALLQALQRDGRAPLKVLAEACGLSVAATAERLRRLQDAGVVRGVHAELDPVRAGYGVQAVVAIQAPQPGKQPLLACLQEMPEVLECHHVTGADSYLVQVVAVDLAHLETLVSAISRWGETRTSLVFSTPIRRRPLQPPRRPA